MNRSQTAMAATGSSTVVSTGTSTGGHRNRELLDAIFAALASASAFVPLGSTHPGAPLDAEPHTVPRFRGWIDR